MQIVPPTCEELFNEEGFRLVYRDSDPSWRHGTYETHVFLRESDGTYWMANFNLQTDGEYHGLRDGDADIFQVWPKKVETIIYTNKEDTDEREQTENAASPAE